MARCCWIHKTDARASSPVRYRRSIQANRLNQVRSGLRPETRQGALPPGSPPKAEPLESTWFGAGRRPYRVGATSVSGPLPTPNKTGPKGLPLARFEGAELLGGVRGEPPILPRQG